jgi:PAS domain S-box-containing protein
MYVLMSGQGGSGLLLTYANPRFLAATGYTLEECAAPDFWSGHIHPEDRAAALAGLERLAREESVEQAFRFRCRDGSFLWVRERVALKRPIREPLRLLGAWLESEDSLTRKVREEAEHRHEALYRSVVQGLPDAFVVLDETGLVLEWGQRAEQMFGLAPEEALGCRLDKLILRPDAYAGGSEAFIRFLRVVAERPDGHHRRFAARRRDGGTVPVEIQLSLAGQAPMRRYVGFVRDISERLQGESHLLQAQKLEAIGQLTGGLAHDFNNILGIVIGNLELLQEELSPDERKLALESALLAAQRGVEVTRSLLAVARRQPLEPREVNLNLMLREMEPLIRQTAGKQVQVAVAPVALDAVSHIDPGGFNNAILNLVLNARDAMPKGGALCVYTHFLNLLDSPEAAPEVAPGEYIAVGVDDTGSGMEPDVAARAFDPFFTTKGRGKGTGLGLAMVYGFARQSGGTAQIRSVPGKGTLITLLLPVANPSRSGLPLVEVNGEARRPAPYH